MNNERAGGSALRVDAQPAVQNFCFATISGDGDAALLVEGDVGNAAGLGGGDIGAAGVATIGGDPTRRYAGAGDMNPNC